MEQNHTAPNLGILNEYFGDAITLKEFLDNLADVITEYSSLSVQLNDHIIPFETAFRISMLGDFHKELRKSLDTK